MVVPDQFEASITIQQAIQELVQLNERHAFSYSRDELVQMLDQALARMTAPSSTEGETSTEAQTSPQSQTPPSLSLHEAALTGDLDLLKRQIEADADVNEKEPSGGSSPLITAALFGQTEIARALIDAGADVNQTNNDG